MVAAWIKADTGVGPSMASGNHTCSGNCADFAAAPQTIRRAAMAFDNAQRGERIDMDECSNAADEDKHRLAQLIQGKTERDLENPRNVDPVWLGCRDVRLEKNPAATDKAYQHGRVRNNTAQRF